MKQEETKFQRELKKNFTKIDLERVENSVIPGFPDFFAQTKRPFKEIPFMIEAKWADSDSFKIKNLLRSSQYAFHQRFCGGICIFVLIKTYSGIYIYQKLKKGLDYEMKVKVNRPVHYKKLETHLRSYL